MYLLKGRRKDTNALYSSLWHNKKHAQHPGEAGRAVRTLGVSRLQRPPTLTPSNHKLNYNYVRYVDISTTDFSLPKGNKCVSTLGLDQGDAEQVPQQLLLSRVDSRSSAVGGDELTDRWEEDVEDGLSNRSRCWRASTAPT